MMVIAKKCPFRAIALKILSVSFGKKLFYPFPSPRLTWLVHHEIDRACELDYDEVAICNLDNTGKQAFQKVCEASTVGQEETVKDSRLQLS